MAVSPLMGFPRGFEEENQEARLYSSNPFMATSSSANNNKDNSSPLHLVEDHAAQEQQQVQQHHNSNSSHHHDQQLQLHQQQQQQQQISFGMMMQSSSSSSIPGNYMNKDTAGGYDLGELDQALFLYLDGHDHGHSSVQEQQRQSAGMRPPTLNIFPSQPMHVEPSTKASTGLVSLSPEASGSKRPPEPSMELADPKNDAPSAPEQAKTIKREGNRRGPNSSCTSEQDGPKTPDPKTLRRLAQNREAARKSRLRKKAYVQQLESSRIRLTQLEQELQRARAQGVFFGGALVGGDQGLPYSVSSSSSEAQAFDMEYARWLEEHNRRVTELRAALEERLPDNELRIFVNNCLAHYDEMIQLKSMVAKSDVFHLVSGMWKTPAERCFMWMGGFRPSEIIKIIINQIEPTGVTEQQIIAIYELQRSTQEAEEALSQGFDALNQSLSETIASDSLSCPPNTTNYMGQMAIAMSKLNTVEGFVRQADNLRHQTIHRLHQLLTTRQAARCLLVTAEYFHRLRALSSLWLARPRQE